MAPAALEPPALCLQSPLAAAAGVGGTKAAKAEESTPLKATMHKVAVEGDHQQGAHMRRPATDCCTRIDDAAGACLRDW